MFEYKYVDSFLMTDKCKQVVDCLSILVNCDQFIKDYERIRFSYFAFNDVRIKIIPLGYRGGQVYNGMVQTTGYKQIYSQETPDTITTDNIEIRGNVVQESEQLPNLNLNGLNFKIEGIEGEVLDKQYQNQLLTAGVDWVGEQKFKSNSKCEYSNVDLENKNLPIVQKLVHKDVVIKEDKPEVMFKVFGQSRSIALAIGQVKQEKIMVKSSCPISPMNKIFDTVDLQWKLDHDVKFEVEQMSNVVYKVINDYQQNIVEYQMALRQGLDMFEVKKIQYVANRYSYPYNEQNKNKIDMPVLELFHLDLTRSNQYDEDGKQNFITDPEYVYMIEINFEIKIKQ